MYNYLYAKWRLAQPGRATFLWPADRN